MTTIYCVLGVNDKVLYKDFNIIPRIPSDIVILYPCHYLRLLFTCFSTGNEEEQSESLAGHDARVKPSFPDTVSQVNDCHVMENTSYNLFSCVDKSRLRWHSTGWNNTLSLSFMTCNPPLARQPDRVPLHPLKTLRAEDVYIILNLFNTFRDVSGRTSTCNAW